MTDHPRIPTKFKKSLRKYDEVTTSWYVHDDGVIHEVTVYGYKQDRSDYELVYSADLKGWDWILYQNLFSDREKAEKGQANLLKHLQKQFVEKWPHHPPIDPEFLPLFSPHPQPIVCFHLDAELGVGSALSYGIDVSCPAVRLIRRSDCDSYFWGDFDRLFDTAEEAEDTRILLDLIGKGEGNA